MKKAIKRNFLKFTGRLGFGRKINDNNDNIIEIDEPKDVPLHTPIDQIEFERGEFDQKIKDFLSYLLDCSDIYNKINNNHDDQEDDDDQEDTKSLNIPIELIQSIFLCIVANSNMLIDHSISIQKQQQQSLNSNNNNNNNNNLSNTTYNNSHKTLPVLSRRRTESTLPPQHQTLHNPSSSLFTTTTTTTKTTTANNIIEKQQTTGYTISKIIPLMTGLTCAYIACTSTTTSEELVQHLFLKTPEPRSSKLHTHNNNNWSSTDSSDYNNNNISGGSGRQQHNNRFSNRGHKVVNSTEQHDLVTSNISRSTSGTSNTYTPQPQRKNSDTSPTSDIFNKSHRYSRSVTENIDIHSTPPPPPSSHQQLLQNHHQQQYQSFIGSGGANITGTRIKGVDKDYVMVDVLIVNNIDIAPLPTRYTLLQMMTYRKVAYKGATFNTPSHFNIIATVSTDCGGSSYHFGQNQNTQSSKKQKFNQNHHHHHTIEPLSPLMLDCFLLNYKLETPIYLPQLQLNHDPLVTTPESKFILPPKRLNKLRHFLSKIHIEHDIDQYIRTIIVNLRNHPLITFGPSPRATPNFTLASKSMALLSGQRYVTPTHILTVATQVLNHRIFLFNPFTINDDQQQQLQLQQQQILQSTTTMGQSPIIFNEPNNNNDENQKSSKRLSLLSQASFIPPPPIAITDTSNDSILIGGGVDDESKFDSFWVIKIILDNLSPPL
eukprot:gene8016-9861_t